MLGLLAFQFVSPINPHVLLKPVGLEFASLVDSNT